MAKEEDVFEKLLFPTPVLTESGSKGLSQFLLEYP